MKIPETYEEYLKTPKAYLKQIIESDGLSFEDMMTLYTFNKQAIKEKRKCQLQNTLSFPRIPYGKNYVKT